MILINYDKKDIKEILSGNHTLYNEMSLIADKLRAIYATFGWTHMLNEFSEADNTVETLTMDCLKLLDERGDRVTMSTAGLTVDASVDSEENISIDYSFNLA